MPLFFFDFEEDGIFHRDDEGVQVDEAKLEETAIDAISAVAHDVFAGGSIRDISLRVRDANGDEVLFAQISLRLARAR